MFSRSNNTAAEASLLRTSESDYEEGKTYHDEEAADHITSRPTPTARRRPWILLSVLFISVLANIWQAYLAHSRTASFCEPTSPAHKPKSITGLASRPLLTRPEGFWAPEYEPELANSSDLDALWHNAVSGFGIVALDRQWAATQGLADSRAWKLDRSKSVYVLSAYHAVHCARSLRNVYKALLAGEPVKDHWTPHGLHCFEVIREELMCSATDNLYATKLNATRNGMMRIGYGETRQCVDWEYLRDWAGEHTAGYMTNEENSLGAQFSSEPPTTDGWYIPPAISTDL